MAKKAVAIKRAKADQAPKEIGIEDAAGNVLAVFDDDADDDVVLAFALKQGDERPDVEDAPGFGFTAEQAVALGRALLRAGIAAGAEPTHAESWAGYIEEAYVDQEPDYFLLDDDLRDGEGYQDAEKRILGDAARCLRGGAPVTFSRAELDLVRHLMPAHIVHQSVAAKWVRENYGVEGTGFDKADLGN